MNDEHMHARRTLLTRMTSTRSRRLTCVGALAPSVGGLPGCVSERGNHRRGRSRLRLSTCQTAPLAGALCPPHQHGQRGQMGQRCRGMLQSLLLALPLEQQHKLRSNKLHARADRRSRMSKGRKYPHRIRGCRRRRQQQQQKQQ